MVLRSYFLVIEMFYLVNPICLQRNTYSCYTSRPRNFGVWYMQRWNISFGLSWRSCGLVYYRKVGLNWWRGLKIYVLTYFQVTQKKNTFLGGTSSSAETSNFCNNELVKNFIKRIKRTSLHAVLKKRLVTSCNFDKYIKALNCSSLLVMQYGAVFLGALFSTLCFKFGLGWEKNFKAVMLLAFWVHYPPEYAHVFNL